MNPYAPPQAVVEAPAAPLPGVLWHVSAGKVHVRAGASLPDVCLQGFPSDEPGVRKTFPFAWSPAWARHLPALPLLGWLAWSATGEREWQGSIVLLVAVLAFSTLTWWTGKRGQIHAFQSIQAGKEQTRRAWRNALIAIAAGMAGGFLLHGVHPGVFKNGGGGMMGLVSGMTMVSLQQRRRLRAVGHQDGWFVLTNVHPAAIARLQAIQHRAAQPSAPPLSGLTPPAGSTTARRGSG